MKYWEQFKETVLGKFPLAVMSLAPSSASVERLFSKLGRTKTNYRNRMIPENMATHGMIKLEAVNAVLKEDIPEINIEAKLEWSSRISWMAQMWNVMS